MTDQIPPTRMGTVMALLGVRDSVLLRPGRTWTARPTALAAVRAVACSGRDVQGLVTVHWCGYLCTGRDAFAEDRWRLRTSAADTLGCADTFAAACDLLAVSYGMAPGGYASSPLTHGQDQLGTYRER